MALTLSPLGQSVEEDMGLGFLFTLRGKRQPPSEVMIVAIDRRSAEILGIPSEPRKWPRSLHARLTDTLAENGASAIAFDLSFEEARSRGEDDLLADAIRRASNVVLCQYLKKEKVIVPGEAGWTSGAVEVERLVSPIPPFSQSAVALAPFPLPKVPVRVNRYWTFRTESGDAPTLPVVAFQIFALPVYDDFLELMNQVRLSSVPVHLPRRDVLIHSRNVEQVIQEIRGIFQTDSSLAQKMCAELKKKPSSPADVPRVQLLMSLIQMYQGSSSPYLNFYGSPGTITAIPYHEVVNVQGKGTGTKHALDFKGKAVFVGLSENLPSEQRDAFPTVFSGPGGLDISGVEMAATAFANLLEDRPVQPLRSWAHLLLILLWGLIVAAPCVLLPTLAAALSLSGLAVAYLLFISLRFSSAGMWYPVMIPLLAQCPVAFFSALVWRSREWNRERQNIGQALRRYLPERVVDEVAKNIRALGTSEKLVYGICLQTDAAQYTTLSEMMDPEELSRFMNRYFEVLFQPVKTYGGTVADIVGDSVLAIWVSEKTGAEDREKACKAALDMAAAVDQFNVVSGRLKLPTRIGLHSGYILLGDVGAVNHFEYRPMGDIVNTASRIEGLNKYLGTRILVSDDVIGQLGGFVTRDLGRFVLAGKSKPLRIHELVCRKEDSTGRQQDAFARFAAALAALQSRFWEDAAMKFKEAAAGLGQDGPSSFFLEVIQRYQESPPEESWDGAIQVSEK